MKRHVDALVRDAVRDAMGRRAVRSRGEVAFQVAPPRQAGFGDLACDVGLVLARTLGDSPHSLAAAVVERLRDPHGWLSEVAIGGPGFVNFRFSLAFWRAQLAEALAAGAAYGRHAEGAGRTALVCVLADRGTGRCDPRLVRAAAVAPAMVRALREGGWDVEERGVAAASDGLGATRHLDLAIAVLGPARADEVASLKSVLPERATLRVVGVQRVLVSRDGTPSRGDVTPADLLGEAVRFSLLLARADRPVELDLGLAATRGTDNPVVLVRHACARLARVLGQADRAGRPVAADLASLDATDEEVLRVVAMWPDVVELAGQTLEPDRIARYAVEAAAAAHRWANRHRLLAGTVPQPPARIALAGCLEGILSRALTLCGVTPRERS